MATPSKLESALQRVHSVMPAAEADIDLLRQLLVGEIGTQDQRAAVTRILSQLKPKKVHHTKIARLLNFGPSEQPKPRTLYMDRGTKISDLV